MDETPRGRRRRRALAAAGDEHSDDEVDELLEEIGIPTSDSKKQGKQRRDAPATPPRSAASAEVIELITPPRTPPCPREDASAASVDGAVSTRQRSDRSGSNSDRRASIVDLTSTPSPSAPAPASVATAAREASAALSPALDAASPTSRAFDEPVLLSTGLREPRRPVTCEDSDDSVRIVTLDSDGRSDSDDEYNEIFSTGLRRVVSERPGPSSPAGSPPCSLNFSLPRTDIVASDMRTPPPKKRRRQPAMSSPTPQIPAPSLTSPVPSPGRKRPAKQPAVSRTPGGAATASISVRLERSLDESEVGRTVRQALRTHVYNGKPLSVEFMPSFDCKYPRVIVLDRCTIAAANPTPARSSSTLPSTVACAIYFDAHAYLKLLLEETYAGLTARVKFLARFVERWQSSSPALGEKHNGGAQVFVIVEKVDHALVEYKKSARMTKRSAPGSSHTPYSELVTAGKDLPELSFADLNEVAFQLFMDLGAHTQFTCDSEESASYVAMVAREMVVSGVRKSSEEEFLESVPRLHSFRVGASGVTANSFSNAWLRMLQTIPGVSEDKAQTLMDRFPTFESLMRVYRDPTLTEADKEDLLTDKLHSERFERALSKRIYSVFTSVDPSMSIP